MSTNGPFKIAVLLVVFLLSGYAVGQTPILSDDCMEDAVCKVLKVQADERYRGADLVEALRLYRLAYEVRPDPRLLFNIARLLHKQGKTTEAVPYYQKFIAAPIQDEEQQQKAREYLKQIQPASAPPVQKQVKKPTSQATASPPAVAIRVDAPPAEKPIRRSFWRRHRYSLGLGGVAVAVAIAGVGLGISTWRSYTDLSATCAGSPSDCRQSEGASVKSKALAANVLFGLAGATALVASGVFLFGERAPAVTPTVAVGPGHAGAGLLVRY